MKSSRFDYGPGAAAGWIGLIYVYSGLVWLWALWSAIRGEAGGPAFVLGLRLAATVGVGIGVCATERWGWAAMCCHLAIHAVGSLLIAIASGWALATRPPNILSWQPVLYGLVSADTLRLFLASVLVAVAAAGALRILWFSQAHFDIPYRRPFSMLLQFGFTPSILLAALDLLLLYGWWNAVATSAR